MKKLTLIFWLILIFVLSNMNAKSSGNLSHGIINVLGITINNGEYLIRKLAHAFEFFILGILVFRITKGKFISLFIPILYACLDEFHQFFIPGRFMYIGDIVIDSTGIMFAFILYRYFLYLHRVYEKK